MADFPPGTSIRQVRLMGSSDTSFMREGKCASDDGRYHPLFFNTQQHHNAKKLCDICPVRSECLAWATNTFQHGYWAGTTYSQRRNRTRNPRAFEFLNDLDEVG